MAAVTEPKLYSNLSFWPGELFEANAETEFLEAPPTRLRLRLGDTGSEAFGFSISISGTGFAWDTDLRVAGSVKTIRVFAPQGRTVITFADLAPGTVANDLSNLIFNMFGAKSDTDRPGPNGRNVWNHLLSGNDTIVWSTGADRQSFPGIDAGNDIHNLGSGNDWASRGAGNDPLNSGDGFDRVSFFRTHFTEGGTAFRGATSFVNADGSGTVEDPCDGTDGFTSTERFVGSRFDDVYYGSEGDEIVTGLRGADTS